MSCHPTGHGTVIKTLCNTLESCWSLVYLPRIMQGFAAYKAGHVHFCPVCCIMFLLEPDARAKKLQILHELNLIAIMITIAIAIII